MAHPEFNDGMYWIDPNQGSDIDAIEVYCDIRAHQTCVLASPSEIPKKVWVKDNNDQHVWFGENIQDGYPFTYKADKVQLTFLQLLSSTAYQNITYHCRNSAIYFDKQAGDYRNAAKFMTSNDLELDVKNPKAKYSVVLDECQYKQDKWTRTVFEFRTEKTRRLPIEDIAPVDVGDENQAFGLEIGPVCFS